MFSRSLSVIHVAATLYLRILSKDVDFFQLTHAVLDKELKHCRHHEDLEVNENVKFKAKEFVKKYMAKSGAVYKRDKEDREKGSQS